MTRLEELVAIAIDRQPVIDMHTHLYSPKFGDGFYLWGIDELVTYHYLIAELFRVVPAARLSYDDFWKMEKSAQADLIWRHLFVKNSPISEACQGVLTSLAGLGLDPNAESLDEYRGYFASRDPSAHIDRVMEIANVSSITMTNNVFDEKERKRWLQDKSLGDDARFKAVLRIDPLIVSWELAAKKLVSWGYEVGEEKSAKTIAEVQRFLREWIAITKPLYVATSFGPEFRYPADSESVGEFILENAILPVCAEHNLAMAMMIGSKRAVNPMLRSAGDMSGVADVSSVVNLCNRFLQNRFLVTMLARENQHELCVAARKFRNLMPFGCWWFLNVPSMIEEIETMRFELLGTSFIPQHSDARVIEQLIYKWNHSREIIGKVLAQQYSRVEKTGRRVTESEINRDVRKLLAGNFETFVAG